METSYKKVMLVGLVAGWAAVCTSPALAENYVHPSLTVNIGSTDNVNSTETDTLSDVIVTYSPAIWVAVPGTDMKRVSLLSSNTAPGGSANYMDSPSAFSHYQAYGFGGVDIDEYSDYSERNNVKKFAEGFFQFNLRSGISLNAFDKFTDSEDPVGTGDSTIVDTYTSNRAGFIANYLFSEKFALRADYTAFDLEYDSAESSGKNRHDNSYAGFVDYIYSPKTTIFVGYNYIDIAYDINTAEDNTQNNYRLGTKWQPTEKSKITIVAGIKVRDGNTPAGNSTDFIGELNVSHAISEKTSLNISALQTVSESTVSTAAFSNDTTMSALLMQKFDDKFGATLTASYVVNDYQASVGEADRLDKVYILSPSLNYTMRDWLVLTLGYDYTTRNSDTAGFDYDSNEFYFKLTSEI